LTSLVIAGAAAFVAAVAYLSDRSFRTREALSKLVEQFEARQFFVRLWRFDQITRERRDAWSIEPVDAVTLYGDERVEFSSLSKQALASDWQSDRADMFEVYFFALRVHAWLASNLGVSKRRKSRMLNDTFGQQLLSTFLNHRIIACRLSSQHRRANYFPTYYGLFDPSYRELVNRLGADLLREGRLEPEVREPLIRKLQAVAAHLSRLKEDTTSDPPFGVDSSTVSATPL
jgi:hypothetical protein